MTHQTPGRYCDLRKISEITELEKGMDFRLPPLRREVFLRFYEFHLRYRIHPGVVYALFPSLTEKLSIEQKLWFAFINGNTQNPVTTYLIFRQFPSLEGLNHEELAVWFNREYQRLEFDTDRRHHKSHFLRSVKCYADLIHDDTDGTQQSYFDRSIDEYENFRQIWKIVSEKFHSFGRLSTFSYLEYLRIMGVNLDCDQLFLEDMEGSKSHRNGLAKVLGRDDLDWHDSNNTNFDGKYSYEVLAWLKEEGRKLLQEAKDRFAGSYFFRDVSYFTLESALCTYKSWFRKNRRYPGVYLDMLHGRIKRAEAKWPEEDLLVFWKIRENLFPHYLLLEKNPKDVGLKPEKQNHFRETGEVIMMNYNWPCFQNSYNNTH